MTASPPAGAGGGRPGLEFYARHAPSNEWSTPDPLYRSLDHEFGFTLDAAASAENHKCGRYFTVADDGLAQPWTGAVWCNPPYGRVIAQWVAKAYAESLAGATVVMLIPARTDTGWWHDYVIDGGAEVRFLRGRLNFGGNRKSGHNAPFPSAVVIFRPPAASVTSITRQLHIMESAS
jgi:phage N-6-adenine-methyltransferase